MPIDVIMPRLGLTMETGTVQRWLAGEGDRVEAGEALLEIETDKVVVEVEAPASGVLSTLLVSEGETVPIGALLAHIIDPGEKQLAGPGDTSLGPIVRTPAAGSLVAGAPEAGLTEPWPDTPSIRYGTSGRSVASGSAQEPGGRRRSFSSPRARKRAREAGLNWQTISGSGPSGRVIERDVVRAASGTGAPSPLHDRELEVRSQIRGRARVVEGVSPFHLRADARAHELLAVLRRLQPIVERKTGVQITITDLLVRIAANALARLPRAMASLSSIHNAAASPGGGVGIGIAMATEEGPVVPVVHDAAGMGFVAIALERNRLARKARETGLSPDEMDGGVLALVDLGAYRVDVSQASLAPQRAAVLTVGRIAERPVAVDGVVCVSPTVTVTLSCDPRRMDGLLGAELLDRVVELIEEPFVMIG